MKYIIGLILVCSTSFAAKIQDRVPWRVDVSIGGANEPISATQATYIAPHNAAWTMVVNSGSIAALIACDLTEESSGLTCSVNEEALGLSFTAPSTADVEVCANFGVQSNVAAIVGATQYHYFRIIRTANNAQTVLEKGAQIGLNFHQGANGAGNGGGSTVKTCGIFSVVAGTKYTFRAMYEASSSSGSAGTILIDRGATLGDRDANLTVRQVLY